MTISPPATPWVSVKVTVVLALTLALTVFVSIVGVTVGYCKKVIEEPIAAFIASLP